MELSLSNVISHYDLSLMSHGVSERYISALIFRIFQINLALHDRIRVQKEGLL